MVNIAIFVSLVTLMYSVREALRPRTDSELGIHRSDVTRDQSGDRLLRIGYRINWWNIAVCSLLVAVALFSSSAFLANTESRGELVSFDHRASIDSQFDNGNRISDLTTEAIGVETLGVWLPNGLSAKK